MNILDFQKAAKISGSRFVAYQGLGALLELSLINLMVWTHVKEHGYTFVIPPYLVKSETAFMRLQKIIETIGQFQKIEKELNWYMDRM